MEVTSPGFQRARTAKPFGEPWRKMVGIVLAEHSVGESESSWYAGPTYDVLTIEDMNILYDVKACAGASGSEDIVFQRYQVSNPAIARRVVNAVSGGGEIPALSELDGARVLVEFLTQRNSTAEPYISNCFVFDQMPRSKIPNAKSAAPNSTDVTPGIIDDVTNQVSANAASKDLLVSDNQAGIIWRAREKYIIGNDGGLKYPEPANADTEQKKALWSTAFETAWSAGFQNTYWTTGFDASDDGAIRTELDNSWLIEDADDETTTNLIENGWMRGWKQGNADANTELATNPPQNDTADNSSATIVNADQDAEPADMDVSEWEQTAAKGRTSVWYIEKKKCRLAIGADGSFTIDTRSNGAPIRIQGADGGIKITANGAVVEIGGNFENAVRLTAESIELGGNTARAVLGDAMMNIYNGHDHDETGVKTGKPNQQMTSDQVLSDIVVLA